MFLWYTQFYCTGEIGHFLFCLRIGGWRLLCKWLRWSLITMQASRKSTPDRSSEWPIVDQPTSPDCGCTLGCRTDTWAKCFPGSCWWNILVWGRSEDWPSSPSQSLCLQISTFVSLIDPCKFKRGTELRWIYHFEKRRSKMKSKVCNFWL